MSTGPGDEPRSKRGSRGMRVVRVWVPVLICLSGVALAVIVRTDQAFEAGALLVGAGLSVFALNALFRIGVKGDRERDREAQAREYFERHGRWPDEPGSS